MFSVLGISPCMYSGSFDPNPDYKCQKDPMPVSSLPTECTSFIYDGLICDEIFKFNISNSDNSKSIIFLKQIGT